MLQNSSTQPVARGHHDAGDSVTLPGETSEIGRRLLTVSLETLPQDAEAIPLVSLQTMEENCPPLPSSEMTP